MVKRVFIICVCLSFLGGACVFAQGGDWREGMKLLVYSPRYFGPSAFPIPELRSGRVPRMYEVEARGEFHYCPGDLTKDVFLKAVLPVVRGRAAVEVSFIPWEDYVMSEAVVAERHAAEARNPGVRYSGDVVVSALYRVVESEEWADVLFHFGLKTASGGRLCDARFTDAASYWAGLDFGRELAWNAAGTYYLRLSAAAGFYCWMTNDLVHRQNDAFLYGGGLASRLGCVYIGSDLSGFNGYDDNGDNPLVLRNYVQWDLRGCVVSFRYNCGFRDFLYKSFSVGLIKRF